MASLQEIAEQATRLKKDPPKTKAEFEDAIARLEKDMAGHEGARDILKTGKDNYFVDLPSIKIQIQQWETKTLPKMKDAPAAPAAPAEKSAVTQGGLTQAQSDAQARLVPEPGSIPERAAFDKAFRDIETHSNDPKKYWETLKAEADKILGYDGAKDGQISSNASRGSRQKINELSAEGDMASVSKHAAWAIEQEVRLEELKRAEAADVLRARAHLDSHIYVPGPGADNSLRDIFNGKVDAYILTRAQARMEDIERDQHTGAVPKSAASQEQDFVAEQMLRQIGYLHLANENFGKANAMNPVDDIFLQTGREVSAAGATMQGLADKFYATHSEAESRAMEQRMIDIANNTASLQIERMENDRDASLPEDLTKKTLSAGDIAQRAKAYTKTAEDLMSGGLPSLNPAKYTDAYRSESALILLYAAAEMGHLPAMGRIARLLPDDQRDQAVEYLSIMKKALGPNFENAATKGTPQYNSDFAKEMEAVKAKIAVDKIAPSAEHGLGVTPAASLQGFMH